MTAGAMRPIRELLDREHARGRHVRMWWRDDDAVRRTPALDRLLALANRLGLPLAIAAIPAEIEPSLVRRLEPEARVRVLVHGLRHADHAAPGDKRAEFGPGRPLDDMAAECGDGLAAIRTAFGRQALDVLVPPWNRIAPDLAFRLAACGYAGLSTFGPRRPPQPPGLAVVNTHLDPVDWRGSRSAVDPGHLADALARALASQAGDADPEPIGLLTHHLVFDEPTWALSAALLETLAEHPAVRIPPPDMLWRPDDVIELSRI